MNLEIRGSGATHEKLIQDEWNIKFEINQRILASNKTVDKKCIEYGRRQVYATASKVPSFAYYGGERSKPKDNPQMAAIGWNSFDGSVEWKCGGSLISDNFIITAAHCACDKGVAPSVVRVGDLNLLIDDNKTVAQDFKIVQIHVHPNYRNDQVYNDIALFEITPNATFTHHVKPACLYSDSHVAVSKLRAMGYGLNAFAGRKTNELFEGNLTLVPNENCRGDFGSNSQFPSGIIGSQMCAKDPEGKSDTCQGDSGGPLIFRIGEGPFAIQQLVGITSFGEFCGGPTPGVYTRIYSYLDWIESIVWPSS